MGRQWILRWSLTQWHQIGICPCLMGDYVWYVFIWQALVQFVSQMQSNDSNIKFWQFLLLPLMETFSHQIWQQIIWELGSTVVIAVTSTVTGIHYISTSLSMEYGVPIIKCMQAWKEPSDGILLGMRCHLHESFFMSSCLEWDVICMNPSSCHLAWNEMSFAWILLHGTLLGMRCHLHESFFVASCLEWDGICRNRSSQHLAWNEMQFAWILLHGTLLGMRCDLQEPFFMASCLEWDGICRNRSSQHLAWNEMSFAETVLHGTLLGIYQQNDLFHS
jgi:hypothetical protein